MEQKSIFDDGVEDVVKRDDSPLEVINFHCLQIPLSKEQAIYFRNAMKRAMKHYKIDNIPDTLIEICKVNFPPTQEAEQDANIEIEEVD